MAKARAFVSSTFYDLKYVREILGNFLRNWGFEPVLFENNGIYFNPKMNIEDSCYREVSLCDLTILIVGGRYGSLSKVKPEELISITRKEFRTAQKLNIPVFVFIEKHVSIEYGIWKTNASHTFQPKYADDLKIYNFIEELQGLYCKEFEKISDILDCLYSQFSGMMYEHLNNIKTEDIKLSLLDIISNIEKIKEIASITAKESNQESYNNVIKEQARKDIADFASLLVDSFIFPDTNIQDSDIGDIVDIYFNIFTNTELMSSVRKSVLNPPGQEYYDGIHRITMNIFNGITSKIAHTLHIRTENSIDTAIRKYMVNIYPLLNDSENKNDEYKILLRDELNEKMTAKYNPPENREGGNNM